MAGVRVGELVLEKRSGVKPSSYLLVFLLVSSLFSSFLLPLLCLFLLSFFLIFDFFLFMSPPSFSSSYLLSLSFYSPRQLIYSPYGMLSSPSYFHYFMLLSSFLPPPLYPPSYIPSPSPSPSLPSFHLTPLPISLLTSYPPSLLPSLLPSLPLCSPPITGTIWNNMDPRISNTKHPTIKPPSKLSIFLQGT